MSPGAADDSVSTLSAGFTLGAAGVAGVAGLGGPGLTAAFAPLGTAFVAGGLWRRNRPALALGCASLVCAALFTGFVGTTPVRALVAVAAAFVSWGVGENAIALTEQLGSRADTRRLEVLHAAALTAVATAGVGLVYVAYTAATGGQPSTAVLLLSVGAMALLAALRTY